MSPRLRPLAALLALWALSLSGAGSAWAALCGGLPEGAGDPPAAVHGHAHHGVPDPAGAGHPGPSGEREGPTCPLMAPGAGSCLGTFLSAAPSARPGFQERESHDFLAPASERGLPDASPPFRPPEA